MRVPTGSICGLISTAALRSNLMMEPSGRRMSFLTRTITAFITSPFFTRPRGIASLTDTTMTSPMVAYLRLEPPSTLMHMTRRATELSATSRLVCIWIIGRLSVWSNTPAHPDPLPPTGGKDGRGVPLLRLLLALDHDPALELGQRPMLLDLHEVADRIFVVLVMRVVFLGAAHRLLHLRMGEAALDPHHHGLGLLVAHHLAP